MIDLKKNFSVKDPRLHFLAFFSVFIFHILSTPAFARSPIQLFVILISCFSFDFIFKFLKNEKIFPLSSIVSSMGIFAIIDTKYLGIYVLAAFLTVGSKYFLRMNDRHIFNPNNFAIVIIGTALSSYMTPGGVSRWGGDLDWSIIVSALGLLLAFSAKRLPVAITFIVCFLIAAAMRSYFLDVHIFLTASILFSPGLLVFTYFMITDPRTSPNGWKLQIVFAFMVAALDQLMRVFEVRLSIFISLFIMTLFYALLDTFLLDKKKTVYVNHLSKAYSEAVKL